jgi:hypothetical protein
LEASSSWLACDDSAKHGANGFHAWPMRDRRNVFWKCCVCWGASCERRRRYSSPTGST